MARMQFMQRVTYAVTAFTLCVRQTLAVKRLILEVRSQKHIGIHSCAYMHDVVIAL